MRILVVDDLSTNLNSARETLVGHDLVFCTTVQEAFVALGFDTEGGYNCEASPFDAVLTDLWLPLRVQDVGATRYVNRSEEGQGSLKPVGLVIAARALNRGVPHIAILTDSDHHQDPLVALMDSLWPSSENRIRKYEKRFFEDSQRRKHWGKLLEEMINGEED
jgi:CheY-like chemotaxis protein